MLRKILNYRITDVFKKSKIMRYLAILKGYTNCKKKVSIFGHKIDTLTSTVTPLVVSLKMLENAKVAQI